MIMKNRQSTNEKPAKTAMVSKSTKASAPQRPQGQKNQVVTLPIDLAAQRRAVKDVYLNRVGANVLSFQMRTLINDGPDKTAEKVTELFIAAIKESVQPRDAIEEMLMLQMAWTHARLAYLSAIASQQTETKNVQVLNDACDRAANTFRRMMLALAEYRRPPRTDAFVAIKQANVANQQVVQNVENQPVSNPNFPKCVASNEQGSTPALPPVVEGIGLPAGDSTEKQAVASEHRPQDGSGHRAIETECDETRRA
jgi:hypothetical protein